MLGLFFPKVCMGCERPLVAGERHVCLHCLEGLPKPDLSHLTENDLARKLWGRLPLNGAVCLWSFEEDSTVRHLIHRMKYDNRPAACRYLGGVLGRQSTRMAGSALPWDAIAYVPMHRRKERKRGYNQARLLAEGLAAEVGLPVIHAVQKHVDTGSQTKLGRAARWQNVRAAFSAVKKAESVTGLRILLVDDVLTTGATLEGAARPLLEAGASQIGIAVLATVT